METAQQIIDSCEEVLSDEDFIDLSKQQTDINITKKTSNFSL